MYKTLNLFDLPENIRVSLKEDYRNEIFRIIKNKFKSLRKFAIESNINYFSLLSQKYERDYISIGSLKKFSKYANISLDEVQSNIKFLISKRGDVGKIYIELPFTIDKDFAWILGFIITDGHIPKNLSKIEISNKDNTVRKEFLRIMKVKFRGCSNLIYVYEKKNRKNVFQIEIDSTIIARIISLFIPTGKKFDIIRVPHLIFDSDKNIVSSFLQGVYDGDGFVSFCEKSYSRNIGLSSYSESFINDILILLNKLGIHAYKLKKKNKEFYAQITGYNNIKKFSDIINFKQNKRRKLLSLVISTYKQIHHKPLGTSENVALKVIDKIQPCTAEDFMKKYKCSKVRAQAILNKLFSKMLVKRKRIEKRYYLYQVNKAAIPPSPNNC